MHITQEHDSCALLQKNNSVAAVSTFWSLVSLWTFQTAALASLRMSSLQRWWMDSSVGWVPVPGCHGPAAGTVAPTVPALGIRARCSPWAGEWSPRASLNLLPDGCATALTDPRAELLSKSWKNRWLLQQVARVIKPSAFSEPSRTVAYVFIHTSCLFCQTTLSVTESRLDTFYEIKIQAIHISQCDPLQSKFFWKLIQIWDNNYVMANHFTTLLVILPLSHRQI